LINDSLRFPGGGDISRTFNMAVTRLNNQMTLIESDAKQLANSLHMISGLADNISGKVERGDHCDREGFLLALS
jgi:methyl-accepting chemotaxis protein